jgi:uncharacterized membrane protein YbhN (UPF0104 family)
VSEAAEHGRSEPDRAGGDGDGSLAEDFGLPVSLNRRRAVIAIVLGVVLVVGTSTAIGAATNLHRFQRSLASARQNWFALCLLGEVAAYAGYIMAYRDVSRVQRGPCMRLWVVVRVVVLGFGAFALASSAGGLAIDFWALQRATGKRRQAIVRTLGLNTLEWAVLAVAAFVSALLVLAGRGHRPPLSMTLSWLIVVPICFALALWLTRPSRADDLIARLLAPRRRRRVRSRLGRAVQTLERGARIGLADSLSGIVVIRALIRHPLRHPAGVFGFVVYWAGDLLALYAALRAFQVALEPSSLIVAYTTAYVVTALPLPVGGAGATEATLAWMLHLVGTPWAPALLGAVAYRAFAFWLPIIPAVAFVPLAHGLADDLAEIRRRSDPPDLGGHTQPTSPVV